jgi:hypothetical protein
MCRPGFFRCNMNHRITHDYAWAGAFDVLAVLRPMLRELSDDHMSRVFMKIYECLKSVIVEASAAQSHEARLLNPTKENP